MPSRATPPQQQQQVSQFKRVSSVVFPRTRPKRATWLMLTAALEPPRGGGSDGSAHGGDMSGCPSQQHWRRPLATAFRRVGGQKRTKPHGDRRPSVHRWSRSSSSCLTKSPAGRGLTALLASGRRNGSSDTHRRQCAGRAVSRCSCAADGRAAGGCPLPRGGVREGDGQDRGPHPRGLPCQHC